MFTQNSCYDRDWLEKNWKIEDELRKYLGIKVYSGLSWSPKTYSQPAVDLHVLDDFEFAAL